MMRRQQNAGALYSKKGFTLVELLVVLVIIALLAALIVPGLFGFIDSAKKKQVIARGETALSATQAALSDIYSSNDNKYTVEKRNQTRINAGAAESTAFTVWNAKPLYDERSGSRESTTAIVEEIGSYTVSKALYKDDDSNFAAYNGADWQVFDSEAEAKAALGITEGDESVIYVWPYETLYCDSALQPDGEKVADLPDPDPDIPDAVTIKKVTLKREEEGKAFFAAGADEDESGEQSITISFAKDDLGGITADWVWPDGSNSFTKDALKLVLNCARTYIFRYWQEEGTEFTAERRSAIESYIFSEENEEKTEFTFIATVMRDPNVKEQATLSNPAFKSFLGNYSVTAMEQVIDEEHDEEYFKKIKSSKRVDDGSNDPYVIYAWMDGTTLKWWTNALVAFLPENCDEMCSGKGNIRTISFRGFDAVKVKSMARTFKGSGITGFDPGEFAAPGLTDMTECFMECKRLVNLDLGAMQELGEYINLEGVCHDATALKSASFGNAFRKTKISGSLGAAFYGDTVLETVEVANWDVSLVTSMESSFRKCHSLKKIDFGSKWELTDCETLLYAFYECGKNTTSDMDFHELKTGDKVTNMAEAFKGTPYVKLDLRGLDPTNVTNMRSMFRECKLLEEVDTSTWKPQKVVNMKQTFQGDLKLKYISLKDWNLSDIELMDGTFSGCSSAEIVTEGLNSEKNRPKNGKLRSVINAFNACSSMTGTVDLSDWDMTGLNGGFRLDDSGGEYTNTTWYDISGDIENMFKDCKNIEGLILKNWDLSNAKQLNTIFSGCSSLKVLDISGWRVVNTTGNNMAPLFGAPKDNLEKYLCKNAYIEAPFSLGGRFNSAKKLEMADLSGLNAPAATGAGEMFKDCVLLSDLRLENMKLSGVTSTAGMFNGCKSLESLDLSSCAFGALTDMNKMFSNCTALKNLDLSGMDASSVTNMSSMFENCTALSRLDMSKFNCSSAASLSKLFYNLKALETLDLENMNASSATNLSNMFENCTALKELDLSKFKCPSAENMSYMFHNCSALSDLEIKGMDTSSVTNMSGMFENCTALTKLDLSKFDSSSATSMYFMFHNCSSIEKLDLSGFDMTKVKDIQSMFKECKSLKVIEFGEKCVENSITNANMFGSCFKDCENLETIYVCEGMDLTEPKSPAKDIFRGDTKLKGGNGTAYSVNNWNQNYAHVDEDGNPGYFTLKK